MFYTVKIYDLNNTTNNALQFSFEAGWFKIRWYMAVATFFLSRIYKALDLEVTEEVDGYDLVYYQKSNNKKIIGVIIEEDEYIDGDVNLST